jgi:hypothetical protein
MITFSCACGKSIKVKDEHAGKKGKCPACQQVVRVPKPEPVAVESAPAGDDFFSKMLEQSYEQQGKNIAADEPKLAPEESAPPPGISPELLAEIKKRKAANEPEVQARKLPFFLDVFLFPLSMPGIIQIIVYVVLSVLLDLAKIVTLGMSYFIGRFFRRLVDAYIFWYFCECVRESGRGAIRAPDVVTNHPDMGDTISELKNIGACIILFALPAVAYHFLTDRIDGFFFAIVGASAFLLPMALLGVIMFGTLTALNPVLLIPSIISTFVPYVGVTIVLWIVFGASIFISYAISQSIILWIISRAFLTYMMLIAGHILGRFFYKNSARLNWEV